jgi:hypothetical protein
MLIKKGGIYRNSTQKKFDDKFKRLGFKIVEEVKEKVKIEEDLFELTNSELKEKCKERELPIYGTKKELVERLGD